MAFAETQKLIVQLDLKGNLQSGLRGTVKGLRDLDSATSRTQRSLGRFGRNIEIGAALAGGAILGVVKAASDYESAFAGVRKTVQATEPQLAELSQAFRDLSKTIPISAADLARLGEAGGALGVPIDQMEEFVRVTALLGVTTNLTADEAADALGVLGNVLHLTGDEYSKFASSLVALGNAGASTEADIVAIAERSGAAAKLIGVSTQEILGFSSAVASLGIEAEAGGTALQNFFIGTAKAVADGGKDLKTFAKISGLTAKAFKKSFEKDAGKALQTFLAGLGKLPQGEQLRVLEDLGFNDARITRTLLGLANNTKLVADQMGVANTAFAENTALTKEADQRFGTFQSQLTITKNVLTDMAITIGSKLLPKLTPLLGKLNTFISEHQADIAQFGDDLAGAFERFAAAVGETDWTPFLEGLKISAQLAKDAFNAFNSLPDDFKKLILVGAGINKVTGGLITSIGKDLAGALGSQFLSRGSSPANPLWVQSVNGGVGGPGGSPGSPGGLVDTAFKLLVVPAAVIAIGTALESAVNEVVGKGLFGVPSNKLPSPNPLTPTDPFAKLPPPTHLLWFDAGVNKIVGEVDLTKRQVSQADVRNAERQEAIRAEIARANASRVTDSQTERSIINRVAAEQVKTTAAAQQAAFAIRDKDLSVTNNITVKTSVSVRETIKTQTTFKKFYMTAS